jgi:hypothetical protein
MRGAPEGARGRQKELIPMLRENWYSFAHDFGPNFPEKSGDDDDASVYSRGRLRGSADHGAGIFRGGGNRSRAGRCGSAGQLERERLACAAQAEPREFEVPAGGGEHEGAKF